jgi:hypothetical protein
MILSSYSVPPILLASLLEYVVDFDHTAAVEAARPIFLDTQPSVLRSFTHSLMAAHWFANASDALSVHMDMYVQSEAELTSLTA